MFEGLNPPYGCIVADPPWAFSSNSAAKPGRNARRHYATMKLADIQAMPVAELAAEDATLFLCATNPMLPHALAVMAAWEFRYKTVAFIWAKTTTKTDASWVPKYHFGLGHWTRANGELVLMGVRGRPKRLAGDVRQLIVAPRREHSRKPDLLYESIRRLVGGPYLDLFARERRPGWDAFGNEIEKFGPLSDGHGTAQKALPL